MMLVARWDDDEMFGFGNRPVKCAVFKPAQWVMSYL
jgi:hypothetical protein